MYLSVPVLSLDPCPLQSCRRQENARAGRLPRRPWACRTVARRCSSTTGASRTNNATASSCTMLRSVSWCFRVCSRIVVHFCILVYCMVARSVSSSHYV